MALPFTFSTTLSGTTLTLIIKSDPGTYTGNIAYFDADINYPSTTAVYQSTTAGAGFTVQGNGATPGLVRVGGFASDGVGTPGTPTLASIVYTLIRPGITDFPITVSNADSDAQPNPTTGSADPTVACFAAGTLIRTVRGDVAVEALQEGDQVVTVGGALRPIVWLGQRRTACAAHPAPHDVMPVRIAAGAFGAGLPVRDLVLSPDHAVFVDGAFIPVRYLLNGATITQEYWTEITYHHVELDRHDVLFAEGLPAESYLDSGNRATFGSTDGVVVALNALDVWATKAHAPLVVDGPALAQAKESLLAHAPLLGHGITDDAAAHLIVDGAPIHGRRDGATLTFAVPPGNSPVRLVSRAMVPAHMVPTSHDTRTLGIAVTAVEIDGTPHVPAGDGWHSPEPGLVWTNSDATLPRGRTITVTTAPLGRYWGTTPQQTTLAVAA